MTCFPSNLKYLREEHKLSQQETANKLGIKQSTYSNYERGNTEPNLELLLKISKFFRTSLDMLVGYTLLEQEDRDVAESLSISNAKLIERAMLQGGEIAIKKAMKKEPKKFDQELINAYKKEHE